VETNETPEFLALFGSPALQRPIQTASSSSSIELAPIHSASPFPAVGLSFLEQPLESLSSDKSDATILRIKSLDTVPSQEPTHIGESIGAMSRDYGLSLSMVQRL